MSDSIETQLKEIFSTEIQCLGDQDIDSIERQFILEGDDVDVLCSVEMVYMSDDDLTELKEITRQEAEDNIKAELNSHKVQIKNIYDQLLNVSNNINMIAGKLNQQSGLLIAKGIA